MSVCTCDGLDCEQSRDCWRRARRMTMPRLVYRLYGTDGHLLYIGQSVNVERRIREHRRKPWGNEIAECRTEGPYIGAAAAEARESEAIHAEQPLYAISRQEVGYLGRAGKARADKLRAIRAIDKGHIDHA